ncbi:MAG: hypothetical protein SFU56_08170 [Capsulimonadales bacterium]|nr:hypothetical protein [Capsulimonadales bacterium]
MALAIGMATPEEAEQEHLGILTTPLDAITDADQRDEHPFEALAGEWNAYWKNRN